MCVHVRVRVHVHVGGQRTPFQKSSSITVWRWCPATWGAHQWVVAGRWRGGGPGMVALLQPLRLLSVGAQPSARLREEWYPPLPAIVRGRTQGQTQSYGGAR